EGGVQRVLPLAGDWGCPPVMFIPPLLEERGLGGKVIKPHPPLGVWVGVNAIQMRKSTISKVLTIPISHVTLY
ncbi:MAG: hypothetical protein WBC82_00440, partial [Dehalococcoidia bacterium]